MMQCAAAAAAAAAAADRSSISLPLDPSAVVLELGGGIDKVFHFDAVLDEGCSQLACYSEAQVAGDDAARGCVLHGLRSEEFTRMSFVISFSCGWLRQLKA